MSWQDSFESDPNHWMVEFVLTEIKAWSTNFFTEIEPEAIPHIEVFKAFKSKGGSKLYFTLSDDDKLSDFCIEYDITRPEIEIVENIGFPNKRVTRIYFGDNHDMLYCLPRMKIE